jgi:hypothetical protein
MALSENGHIAETEGKKMHHEEGIVIVGGGLGGLCFAAALHKYIITPYFQIVIMISWENVKPLLIEFDVKMGSFFKFGSRVGLKAVVLEQSDKLRSEGTAISLSSNGMRVLDIFDLANQFRNIYFNIPRGEYLNQYGRRLTIMDLSHCEGG